MVTSQNSRTCSRFEDLAGKQAMGTRVVLPHVVGARGQAVESRFRTASEGGAVTYIHLEKLRTMPWCRPFAPEA